MLVEARNLATNAVVDTDICIVGAGPVGIVLAWALVQAGHNVSVLESGGLTQDPLAASLNRGESAGWGDYLAVSRARQFGGTANRWIWETQDSDGDFYGRFAVPDPIDF